jgi:hypothetical protein
MVWRALGAVALVVLAGCSFAGGGATVERATLTPAPVPTATPTPADRVPDVAPGLSTTGVADTDPLVDAHVAAARGTTWVWRERRTVTRVRDDVTTNATTEQLVRFAGPRTYYRWTEVQSRRVGQDLQFREDYQQYADGHVRYETWRSIVENEVVYRQLDTPGVDASFVGFSTAPIRLYLSLESARVTRLDRGEQRHYEVVGTRSRLPEEGPVSDYRARAVVRSDGFVKRLNVTYAVEDERTGRRRTVHYGFSYRRVGEGSVGTERPGWVEAAQRHAQ